MTYVDLKGTGHNGPLCPNSFPPFHPLHDLSRRMNDASYKAAPRAERTPEEIEQDALPALTEDAETIRTALFHEQFTDYMHLYRHDTTVLIGRQFTDVTTWWWRCWVCGLVLPTTAVTTSRPS